MYVPSNQCSRPQYKEILRYAAERQIEVIPEVDMPGHAHSAIAAMKARHRHFADLGKYWYIMSLISYVWHMIEYNFLDEDIYDII